MSDTSTNTAKVLDALLSPGSNRPTASGARTPCLWRLEMLLDRIPEHDERRYERIDVSGGCVLYVSIAAGVADFFLHDPRDQGGYGGAKFSGTLVDGSAFTVTGPWSSSCSTVNGLGKFPPLLPVAATASRADWDRGYTLFALSGVTDEVVQQAMQFLPGWEFASAQRQVERLPGRNTDLSDEQLVVVTGEGREHFAYTPGVPVCDVCGGRGSLMAERAEKGAWPRDYSKRDGEWLKPCSGCNVGGLSVYAGSAPIPGTRRYRTSVRA